MNDPNNTAADPVDPNNQTTDPPVLVTGAGGLKSVLQAADQSAASADGADDDGSHGGTFASQDNTADLREEDGASIGKEGDEDMEEEEEEAPKDDPPPKEDPSTWAETLDPNFKGVEVSDFDINNHLNAWATEGRASWKEAQKVITSNESQHHGILTIASGSKQPILIHHVQEVDGATVALSGMGRTSSIVNFDFKKGLKKVTSSKAAKISFLLDNSEGFQDPTSIPFTSDDAEQNTIVLGFVCPAWLTRDIVAGNLTLTSEILHAATSHVLELVMALAKEEMVTKEEWLDSKEPADTPYYRIIQALHYWALAPKAIASCVSIISSQATDEHHEKMQRMIERNSRKRRTISTETNQAQRQRQAPPRGPNPFNPSTASTASAASAASALPHLPANAPPSKS